MEQTPLPPLLSDEILAHLNCRCENCVRRVAKVIEADRAKIREVVQALVDALDRLSKEMDCGDWGEVDVNGDVTRPLAHDILAMPGGCPKCKTDKVLALAKSQMNIEPTKP